MQNAFTLLLLDVLHKAMVFLKRSPGERGIRMSSMRALGLIRAHPGITPSQFASQLNVRPSSATELIHRLVSKGLVKRLKDAQDRRSSGLSITAKGESELTELLYEFDREITQLCQLLTSEEQMWLERIFKKLDAELANIGKRGDHEKANRN